MLDRARSGDLVYFDPPYDPVSPTASFTACSLLGFSRADQEQLHEVFETLSNRNVSVMRSRSDMLAFSRLWGSVSGSPRCPCTGR